MRNFRTKARKYVRRQFRRGKRWAKARYMPRGKLNVGRIVKDVNFLKSIVNAEKKYVAFTETFDFGLSTGASSGHYVQSLVSLSQGTTVSTRNGNSVKGTSLQYSIQVSPQASTTTAGIPYMIFILQKPGALWDDVYTTGTTGTLANLFLSNDYSGYKSHRSLREIEHFRDWRILRCIRGYMRADESSTAGSSNHIHKGGVKLYRHFKFDGANTPCQENQLYYLFVAGAGSVSSNTALTAYVQYRLHFIDN